MTKKTETNTEAFKPAELTPFYECKADGVYYCSFDERGDKITEKRERLSDMIKLLGYGYDDDGECYRVFEWRDRLTRETKRGVINFGDIGMNWRELQARGIAIKAGRQKRERLADYLMMEGGNAQYTITKRTGWLNDSYILPSGEVLGGGDNIIYSGDMSQASYHVGSGTLEQWQDNIARYAEGNSRLSLFMGASLATPLMRLLNIEGGGFHLTGDSSDGKTSISKAALSVWGNPQGLTLTWEGTSHAFSNTANAKNDNVLFLDEMGQVAPRVISQTIYSVLNGVGKAQGKKEGGNRHLKRWRVLLLSAGEKTPETFLQRGGMDFHAGQAARLPSIPAISDKGHGAYDTVHDMANGAELSDHLQHAGAEYYGVAGRAFVEKVIEDKDNAIKHAQGLMRAFMESLPPLTGQARRVANRFALVAAALELASHYGITGLPTGAAKAPIKKCFDVWLSREGTGKYEDRKVLEQVAAFIEQYGDSERFLTWIDRNPPRDFAGYREEVSGDFDNVTEVEYWVIPPVFQAEICDGFERSKVLSVLEENGMLKRGKDRPQNERRVNKILKRFYVIRIKNTDDNSHTESND